MRTKSITVDDRIARIAGRQHGVVARGQLLTAGLSQMQVKRRVQRAALHTVHRGVYRVGHRAPSTEATYMAAVLACGEGALLSGFAAAHLYRLIKGAPPPPEVTAPGARQVPGVKTRRGERRATTVRGIPTTTIPDTLIDIAAKLTADALARAFHEAAVIHRTTPKHVEAALRERPRAKGAGNLKAAMYGDMHITLSMLEKAFLKLLRAARLPLPQTNRKVDEHYVDCRWPEHRLTVELTSYRYHHTRHAWEADQGRRRAARRRRDEFRSFTYDDVIVHKAQTVAELRALLCSDASGATLSLARARSSAG